MPYKNREDAKRNKRAYYQKNKDKDKQYKDAHKKERSEYDREYYQKNKDNKLQYANQYYQENKEELSEQRKNYRERNKDSLKTYQRTYNKTRIASDPAYALRKNIPAIVRRIIKSNGGSKYGQSVIQFFPYTIQELKNHLEKQFEPWMNWQNWGRYSSKTWNDNDSTTWTWQIDHIIPQSELPYTSMEGDNFKRCWALENLRPYPAKQNYIDGINRIRHTSKIRK